MILDMQNVINATRIETSTKLTIPLVSSVAILLTESEQHSFLAILLIEEYKS